MLFLPERPRLIVPAAVRRIQVPSPAHNLPNELVRADLRGQIIGEAGPGFYACAIFASGEGVLCPAGKHVDEYPEDMRDWLASVTASTNRHAHHGGCWIGAFSNPATFVAMWKDQDGDLVAAYEDVNPWPRRKAQRLDYYVEMCEQAVAAVREFNRGMDIKEGRDTIKRAQGEQSRTVH